MRRFLEDINKHCIDLPQELKAILKSKKTFKIKMMNVNAWIFESPSLSHLQRLDFQKNILKIAIDKNCDFSRAYIMTLLGVVQCKVGDRVSGLSTELDAIPFWEKVINEDLAENGLIACYCEIANILIKSDRCIKALDYIKLAKQIMVNNVDNNLVPFVRINDTQGNVFRKMGNFKLAKTYYQKCIKMADSHPFQDISRKYIYTLPFIVKIADIDIDTGKYEQAEKDLLKALNVIEKYDFPTYKVEICKSLGQIFYLANDLKNSEKYYLMGQSKSKIDDDINNYIEISFKLGELYQKQKMQAKAIEYYVISHNESRSIKWNEYILKSLDKLIILDSLSESRLISYLKRYRRVMNSKYEDEFKILFNDLEKYQSKIVENLETEKSYNSKDFKSRKNLTDSLWVTSTNDFLYKLLNILNEMESAKPSNLKDVKNLKSLLNDKIKNIDSWSAFELQFNSIFLDFTQSIKKKSDKVSLNEIRFCMLIRMGMTNNEIMSILNISSRAVEQNRYRIKKKLKIKQQLTDFILTL